MNEGLTEREKRKALGTAVLIVFFALALAGIVVWYQFNGPSEKAVVPAGSEALQTAAQGLDSIRVECRLEPGKALLTGTSSMTLRNRTGEDLDHIELRSWSGAFLREETSPVAIEELYDRTYARGFSAGGLQVLHAEVNGTEAEWSMADEAQTILTLPCDWKQDETLELLIAWSAAVPEVRASFGHWDNTWSLAHVFPVPSVYRQGEWLRDAYCPIGEPYQSVCANWQVKLTAPAGYTVAASAFSNPVRTGDEISWTWSAQAVRDFAAVLSPVWEEAAGMAGDVMVVARASSHQKAKKLLSAARTALQCYERHFGPYAWPVLTVAESGMLQESESFPGLVMIGTDQVRAGGTVLEYTVAEAAAHQWWSAMVGSDGFRQPWQDESLCTYALMDYIGDRYGASARDAAAFERIETAMRITIPRGVTPGSPIDYFGDTTEYKQVVRGRGAALWMALEKAMGQETLDTILHRYAEEYRFGHASREALEALINEGSGQDWSALFIDYLDTNMD